MYARLDLADAWAIIGPVNWSGPTSNLKLIFDRLVCMNFGNLREDLIAHKDPEKAMALEHDPAWKALSLNHLEGRTAASIHLELLDKYPQPRRRTRITPAVPAPASHPRARQSSLATNRSSTLPSCCGAHSEWPGSSSVTI